MNARTPLNGNKTHPLSKHSIGVLLRIKKKPVPASDINPGVVDRFLREELVEIVSLPSPFLKDQRTGRTTSHLQITKKGLESLSSPENGYE